MCVCEQTRRLVCDLLWADPAGPDAEGTMDEEGFAPSARGDDAICYGTRVRGQIDQHRAARTACVLCAYNGLAWTL